MAYGRFYWGGGRRWGESVGRRGKGPEIRRETPRSHRKHALTRPRHTQVCRPGQTTVRLRPGPSGDGTQPAFGKEFLLSTHSGTFLSCLGEPATQELAFIANLCVHISGALFWPGKLGSREGKPLARANTAPRKQKWGLDPVCPTTPQAPAATRAGPRGWEGACGPAAGRGPVYCSCGS